jgi:hypothetical protein
LRITGTTATSTKRMRSRRGKSKEGRYRLCLMLTTSKSHLFAYDLPPPYSVGMAPGNAPPSCRINVTTTSLPAEGDEGRYRTNALYKEGPKADGLYHCFYEGDPANPCTHKPTKLKCNYEYVQTLTIPSQTRSIRFSETCR